MPTKVRKYLRKLRRDFPTRRPVRVHTKKEIVVDGHKLFAQIWDAGEYIQIVRSKERNQCEDVMVDSLLHEWTHAMLWPKCSRKHSKLFWFTYGLLYRKYVDP